MDTQYQALLDLLSGMKSVVVAFSGGVDSTFLLYAAKESLGDRTLALIGRSATYPKRELDEAVGLAERIQARYRIVDTKELLNPMFCSNLPNRCFACKTELFTIAKNVAKEEGMQFVIEGSNADDTADFRPGIEAGRKLGVRAPLMDLGFTKAKIRELSRAAGLPTWDKPPFACLSSRIPYGEEINAQRLARIERAENAIRDMGVRQLRVRDHGDVARIEVDQQDIVNMAKPRFRSKLVEAVKKAGYKYVCLDLQGYRTGAMNEALGKFGKGQQ
jgi:uncharacterized protein